MCDCTFNVKRKSYFLSIYIFFMFIVMAYRIDFEFATCAITKVKYQLAMTQINLLTFHSFLEYNNLVISLNMTFELLL